MAAESPWAIVVPATAVLHDGGADGATIVYVLDAGRAHARRVTTGAARGDSLEIASGLMKSDRVIVAGQHRLRDGARVQRVDAHAPTAGTTGGATP